MNEVKAICKMACGFEETFEPDEYGLSYFQAIGTCPNCDADTMYEDGSLTRVEIIFTLNK